MMYGGVGFQRTAELVSAVTGWNTSVFELMKVGERAATVARAFNVREGLSPLDDTLPRRFFIPQSSGPLEGVAPTEEAVRSATDSYYNIMGWPQGRPSPGKLAELSLDWVVPVLEGK
jgi:aldehyde:ferredoxin oxidoreductase